MRTGILTALLVAGFAGCSAPTAPSVPASATADTSAALAASKAEDREGTSGGGHFQLTLASGEVVDVQFGMTAVTAGGAAGHFTHRAVLGGLAVEFQGRVTCIAVDAANRRSWVGGIVTRNTSEHPSFTTPRTQPGRDIWFRVLDSGEGQAEPDR